jgi:hypothetical protein
MDNNLLSFWGPMRGSPSRRRDHFASLTHWCESAKFDPYLNPDLIQAVLLMPSSKEALKFTRRWCAQVRTDWALIKTKVVLQGLMQMHVDLPDLDLPSTAARHGLTELIEEMGWSSSSTQYLIKSFKNLASAPRIAVLGERSSTPHEVGRRLTALNAKANSHWSLVHWCGRHSSWRTHDWADQARLGIRYLGADDDRLTEQACERIVLSVDQLLIFDRRGSKHFDRLVRIAKGADIQVQMVYATTAPDEEPSLF